jgi:hypothetical protein
MATAKKYRKFARQCLSWADRAQTLEHREALLDMATCWAEAAAQLEHQQGLRDQFVEIVGKATRRASAIDGNGAGPELEDGRTQPKHADGVSLAKPERQLPREGGETSSE